MSYCVVSGSLYGQPSQGQPQNQAGAHTQNFLNNLYGYHFIAPTQSLQERDRLERIQAQAGGTTGQDKDSIKGEPSG